MNRNMKMIMNMKHYKEVIVPEHVTLEHVITTCDICGEDIYAEKKGNISTVRDVKIRYEHGEVYPDDTNLFYFKPDICSKCFREKIYPYIMHLVKDDVMPWIDNFNERKHDCMAELRR